MLFYLFSKSCCCGLFYLLESKLPHFINSGRPKPPGLLLYCEMSQCKNILKKKRFYIFFLSVRTEIWPKFISKLYPYEWDEFQSFFGICQWKSKKNVKLTTSVDNETTIVVGSDESAVGSVSCARASACADCLVLWQWRNYLPWPQSWHLLYCLKAFRSASKNLLPHCAGTLLNLWRASFVQYILTQNTSCFRQNACWGCNHPKSSITFCGEVFTNLVLITNSMAKHHIPTLKVQCVVRLLLFLEYFRSCLCSILVQIRLSGGVAKKIKKEGKFCIRSKFCNFNLILMTQATSSDWLKCNFCIFGIYINNVHWARIAFVLSWRYRDKLE